MVKALLSVHGKQESSNVKKVGVCIKKKKMLNVLVNATKHQYCNKL